MRDVANFSQTKAKDKNNTFWGKRILEKLGKKKDGEFRFIVFEAKLELEPIDPIFISEKKRRPPWSKFTGGGQLAVHHLACALQKIGHQVHVLYSKNPNEKIVQSVPYTIHWARHFEFSAFNLNLQLFFLISL